MKKLISVIVLISICLSLLCACNKQEPEAVPSESASVGESASESQVDTAALEEHNAYLQSLFGGIVKLEERSGSYGDEALGGGTYVPMRFTHERIEAYEAYGAIAKVGTPYFNCTTGVTMDFITDAPEISFSYVVKEMFFDRSPDHPDDCFALFENGELMETYLVQNGTNTDLVYARKSEGESRITIVFPSWHGIALSNINVGNARPYDEYENSFLFLGDSITQGLFADNPGENWAHIVAQSFNASYYNLAVGGEVFRNDAFDYIEGFNPTHIFVALGENDYYSGVPEAQMAQNCRNYLTEVKMMYPGVPVTVVSSFNHDKPESWTNAMLSVAKELGCNAIDGTGFASAEADSWNADRVHPSSKGFKEIAECMVTEIALLTEE